MPCAAARAAAAPMPLRDRDHLRHGEADGRGRGHAFGRAVLEHVQPCGGRRQLDGDVRRPVQALCHREHALAIARAQRVDLRAHEARLVRGPPRTPAAASGSRSSPRCASGFGLLLGRQWPTGVDRLVPALTVSLHCRVGEERVRRHTDAAALEAAIEFPSSAESCHHCVAVFSMTQSR